MTDTLAASSFLPWAHRGVISAIAPSGGSTPGARAPITLSVGVNDTDPASKRSVALHLYGPGDVIGIDQRIIVRTVPSPQSSSFEPNFFPAIDFADPTFPWMFTPLGVRADEQKLLPWICLIVVR